MAKKEAIKFTISDAAKKTPRRYLLGKTWVGVGGDIHITPNPPAVPSIIKEATEKQYIDIAQYSSHVNIEK